MDYPHQSGDVTVIGPEVFIDQAREVISYQGQNYYRQVDLPLPEAIHFHEGSTHAVSQCRPEKCGLEPGEQARPGGDE